MADAPSSVDDDERWHTPKLQQVHFLAEEPGDPVGRVGKPHERDSLRLPVAAELVRSLRADRDHFDAPSGELLVVLAQLRQMPLAVWSAKASGEDEHDGPSAVIRQSHRAALGVDQLKVWRLGDGDARFCLCAHGGSTLLCGICHSTYDHYDRSLVRYF